MKPISPLPRIACLSAMRMSATAAIVQDKPAP